MTVYQKIIFLILLLKEDSTFQSNICMLSTYVRNDIIKDLKLALF